MEIVAKPGAQPSTKRVQLADRLTIGITKRKRSTPQKFLGELSSFVLNKEKCTFTCILKVEKYRHTQIS